MPNLRSSGTPASTAGPASNATKTAGNVGKRTGKKKKGKNTGKKNAKKSDQVRDDGLESGDADETSDGNNLSTEDRNLFEIAKRLRDAGATRTDIDGKAFRDEIVKMLSDAWNVPDTVLQEPARYGPKQSAGVPSQPERDISSTSARRATPDSTSEFSERNSPGRVEYELTVLKFIQYLYTTMTSLPTRLPAGISPNEAQVYNSAKMDLGVVPHSFHGIVRIHKSVSYNLRLLFDESTNAGRRQYEKASTYMYDLQISFENLLNWGKDRFGGEPLLECLCDKYLDKSRDHPLTTFEPVKFLDDLIKTLATQRSDKFAKARLQESAQHSAQHASASYHHSSHLYSSQPTFLPPPPGLGHGRNGGKHLFKDLKKWGRFPQVPQLACVLCGKGIQPGSKGHMGNECQATDAEVHNWVENGVWVV